MCTISTRHFVRSTNTWLNIKFKNFDNEDDSLEDEDYRCPTKQLKFSIEKDICKTNREVAEHLNVDHSTAVWHCHQNMPKKTIRCHISWIKIKKIKHYKVYSVLLFTNKNSLLHCTMMKNEFNTTMVDILQRLDWGETSKCCTKSL